MARADAEIRVSRDGIVVEIEGVIGRVRAAERSMAARSCWRAAGPGGPSSPGASGTTVRIARDGLALTSAIRPASRCRVTHGRLDRSGNAIEAPLHGVVSRLHVALGDTVEKGAPVLQMEAMKLIHTLKATAAGPHRGRSLCTVGDTVPAGAILVEITPVDSRGETLMAGLWFEEFKDGMVFNHEWSRTITETDNVWFSLLTMNVQPLHIDAHYAAKSEWGKPLVNSLFTLGLMIGMSVNDTTFGTTLANLGMSDVRFPKPLFQGDSVKVRTTVRSKRESKSRTNEGIVNFYHEMINQDGVVVATCERAALMRKRPAGRA